MNDHCSYIYQTLKPLIYDPNERTDYRKSCPDYENTFEQLEQAYCFSNMEAKRYDLTPNPKGKKKYYHYYTNCFID